MKKFAVTALLALMPQPLVWAQTDREWSWAESACSPSGDWLTFKGKASVKLVGSQFQADLYEAGNGSELRHKLRGKIAGNRITVTVTTMNTDSGDVQMTGKRSSMVLKSFSGAPTFEHITLFEGCSFIGLSRTVEGRK